MNLKKSIKFAVRSEIGLVRTNNEDNFYCNGVYMTVSERERPFFMTALADIPSIFAVCDGMGGEDCGELASLTAIETLAKHSKRGFDDKAINDFVVDANDRICLIMKEQGLRMGTTLALAVVRDDSFMIYNVGDSRIYRLENNRLVRVSNDHTLAEDKVRMGLITPAKAEKDRDRHVLTRYLGIFDEEYALYPDSYGPFSFESNKRILLCSDGLTEMLDYNEMALIMNEAQNVAAAVNNLVDAALSNGGRDNVTCIVLEV